MDEIKEMTEQEEIDFRRFWDWATDPKGKTCKTCQWSGYSEGDRMVTCGSNIQNFTPNSSCGGWTSPKDVDLLRQQAETKERLLKKLKTHKLCGCDYDCSCKENFNQNEKLKKHFEKNGSVFNNFLCVETDKGNPKCKIQCPFCERV